MSHAKYVPHCKWKNTVALVMAGITAGAWIPFASSPGNDAAEEDDESTSIPAPLFETHAPLTWPEKVVPRPPVSLVKHPKPVHNPVTDPTHARPTPKVPVSLHKPTKVPVVARIGAGAIVAFLNAQLGKPYVFGGNGPNVYDCSGLTRAAYAVLDIHLPRTSQAQSVQGVRVPLDDMRPGDLVFWGVPGLAFHVGIYVGNGYIIAANNPTTGVVKFTLGYYMPSFARRIL